MEVHINGGGPTCRRDNKHQLWAWISYYLFLRREHPIAAKLGVPQKIVYLLIPLMIFFTGYTGFCLWGATAEWPIFAVGLNFLGGAMKVRILHYFMMWAFLAFMCIHVYLSLIEGVSPATLIFFWKETSGLVYDPETMNIVGFDGMGKESDYGETFKSDEREAVDRAVMGYGVVPDLMACGVGMVSLHEVRFSDVLAAATFMGAACKARCFGAQVLDHGDGTMERGLSPRVEAAVSLVSRAVVRHLDDAWHAGSRDL